MGRRTVGRRGRTPVAMVAVLCTAGALGVTAVVPGQAAASPSSWPAGAAQGAGDRAGAVSASPVHAGRLLPSDGDPDP
ncbi:hypothetical protein ABZS63_08490, partial [Streptomyces sp. NPDC005568]